MKILHESHTVVDNTGEAFNISTICVWLWCTYSHEIKKKNLYSNVTFHSWISLFWNETGDFKQGQRLCCVHLIGGRCV